MSTSDPGQDYLTPGGGLRAICSQTGLHPPGQIRPAKSLFENTNQCSRRGEEAESLGQFCPLNPPPYLGATVFKHARSEFLGNETGSACLLCLVRTIPAGEYKKTEIPGGVTQGNEGHEGGANSLLPIVNFGLRQVLVPVSFRPAALSG